MKSDGRNPLFKAILLLREMLDLPGGESGVRELARSVKLSPSTVHRALGILEEAGLVQHEPESGRYRLGLEFYRLAWRAQSQLPIRDVAMRFLPEIVSKCNETTFLGLYDPQRMEMVFAASVDSTHPLRYVVPLHQWFPVYASASGLAVMAFLSQEERQRIIRHTGLAPVTDRTITDPIALEKELEQIRSQGYAYTQGRRIPGAISVATPIFGPAKRVIGDLVVTIPEQRFDSSREKSLARLLIEYARRISEHLGA